MSESMGESIRAADRAMRDLTRAINGLVGIRVRGAEVRARDQIEVSRRLYSVATVYRRESGAVFIDALRMDDTGSITLRVHDDDEVAVYRQASA